MKSFLKCEILYIEEDLSDIADGDEIDEKYITQQETRKETLDEILKKFFPEKN